MPLEKVVCPECGYPTEINMDSRKSKPRFCRNCGAKIREAKV